MRDSAPFEDNVFAGSLLDRAGHVRRDAEWVRARFEDPSARFLPLWHLKTLTIGEGAAGLAWLPRGDVADDLQNGAQTVLLGLDQAHGPRFAVDVSARSPEDADPPFAAAGAFHEARALAMRVSRADAAILAQARSMIDWHARHRFCAKCGQPTQAAEGGYVRRCSDEACGAQHFPRTDPVVIMLVIKDEQCLVGRQKFFPKGMYSALAGFLEPGETIEEAVRREVMEEAGIEVGAVYYHSSQPWPYPSSLMIGCHAEALTTEITIDGMEIEDARWFGRPLMREALALSGKDPFLNEVTGAGPDGILAPAPMAIAHQLIKAWVEG
ncbi:MAG: NAD(+) diphosphatase [Proteobacteria bacterium]|nr:NAD(+) diphosphatase [Pseudomonadota bacterium]